LRFSLSEPGTAVRKKSAPALPLGAVSAGVMDGEVTWPSRESTPRRAGWLLPPRDDGWFIAFQTGSSLAALIVVGMEKSHEQG
jgi:hypothetical protein